MKKYLLGIILALAFALPFNANAAHELLAATTSATQSNGIVVLGSPGYGDYPRVTFIIYAASGHTAAEYSDVQISHDNGTTWADVYIDGSQVRLHSTNTVQTVYGPGIYRIDKEATTNATAVYAATYKKP